MYRFALFLFLSCVTLSLFCGCDQYFRGDAIAPNTVETPEVSVYTVKSESVPLIRELLGRTTAFNVAEVRPQVSCIILKRKFEEGSFVEEGEELYEIDAAVYQANYEKAIANLQSLESTKERFKSLVETKAVSQQEYEDALYAADMAKADLKLAQLDLDYSKVKAPLSGKIGRSSITVGALVTNGQGEEMAVIQQLDPIYVDLKPAVAQVLRMKNDSDNNYPFWQGAKVSLILEDGSRHPHSGMIKFLDNHVLEDTGTVTLRAEIPNPGIVLLPGMFVRALVEEGVRQDGLLIPQEALCRDFKGNPYVWIVGDDNIAEMRSIQTELTLGNTWLVDDGIKVGERIIVEGIQFVTSDVAVIPTESEKIKLKRSFEDK